jgi:hypothetical protein
MGVIPANIEADLIGMGVWVRVGWVGLDPSDCWLGLVVGFVKLVTNLGAASVV